VVLIFDNLLYNVVFYLGIVMKKCLFWILLSLSSSLYAVVVDKPKICLEFDIQVQNTTNNVCYLSSFSLRAGDFYSPDDKPISVKILPGETQSLIFRQIANMKGPTIRLVYECGTGEVMIESHKNTCVGGGDIDGLLLNSVDMTATFQTQLGDSWNGRRGVIQWTLANA
jgi:hypothetical protein